jgi:IclR family acetate operon transcriptional repressor
MPKRAELEKYSLESVDRMAAVLKAVAEAAEQPLDRIALRADLNESTALRYLLSLTKHGLIDRDDSTGLFRLGLELFRLGTQAIEDRDVVAVADPVMRELQARFGESINLAERQRDQVVLIRVLESRDSIFKGGRAGGTDPWHATSLGKALLGALPRADCEAILGQIALPRFTPNTKTTLAELERDLQGSRQQGYAVDDEEVVEGLRCVGVPIQNYQGQARYGLSVSGPKSRMTYARLQEIGSTLVEVAKDLSLQLGAGSKALNSEAPTPGRKTLAHSGSA